MANLDEVYDVDERHIAFENHSSGILVSLAGPGTGKTYSFLRRIRSLTRVHEIDSENIAYLTFIREISKVFIDDFEEEFANEGNETQPPRVSTLHSFACRLIRNRGFTIGYDGPLYFASIATPRSLLSQVFLSDLAPQVSHLTYTTIPRIRRALGMVKDAWRGNKDPMELDEPIPSMLDICLHLSRSYRLIDWDQAISFAHQLFLDPSNRQRWLTQIKHYLIDEFQDFNDSEQAFIISLASTVTSMVIVGDDSQSIYSGRGSSLEGIRNLFESQVHDTVTLLRCRRCRAGILGHVNTFLSILRPSAEHMLSYYDGGSACCYRFKSTKSELAFLTEFLNERIDELPPNPRSKDGIVCLFPSLRARDFYFESLRSEVSCHIRGTLANDQRDLLSRMLELIYHPHQRYIERLILENFQAIKPRHKRAMVQIIMSEDISPVDAISILVENNTLKGTAVDEAMIYVNLCNQLSLRDVSIIAESISDHFAVELDQIQETVANFIENIGEVDQDEAIEDFCDRILPTTSLPPEDPHSVLFLTMHGSKGLTKRTVVMPGLEDAWLPGQASAEEANERARLFYVALSRARELVQITYPRHRARGDPLNFDISGRGEVCRYVTASGILDVYHS